MMTGYLYPRGFAYLEVCPDPLGTKQASFSISTPGFLSSGEELLPQQFSSPFKPQSLTPKLHQGHFDCDLQGDASQ